LKLNLKYKVEDKVYVVIKNGKKFKLSKVAINKISFSDLNSRFDNIPMVLYSVNGTDKQYTINEIFKSKEEYIESFKKYIERINLEEEYCYPILGDVINYF